MVFGRCAVLRISTATVSCPLPPYRKLSLTGVASLAELSFCKVPWLRFAGGFPQPRTATDVRLTSLAAFGLEDSYFLTLGCHQVMGWLLDTGESCHGGAGLAGSPGPGSEGLPSGDRKIE